MNAASNPASAAQLAYLRDLAKKRAVFGPAISIEQTLARIEEGIAAGLSRDGASALIDQARRAPTFGDDVMLLSDSLAASLVGQAATKAIYGLAYTPEETVAKVSAAIEAGMSMQDGRVLWRVGYAAKPHPTAKQPLPLHLIEGIEDLAVSEGHYAVFHDDVLRFYAIYEPGTGEYRGQPVMRRYASANLLALYPGEARQALQAIAADPDVAAYRFADHYTRCFVCGKSLTDAVSRLISVGPSCRGFTGHSGLKSAASEVDHDATRRTVYRALREWALARGYRDPRTKQERETMAGVMSASRLAAAWSGLPGLLAREPAEAVAMVTSALGDTQGGAAVDADLRQMLLDAPADTLLVLVGSGVLSQQVLMVLTEHASKKVRDSAGEFFLAALGA